MKKALNQWLVACSVVMLSTAALAKLPAPSDEAKAKAAEAGAKTAWSGKVDGYKLCKSQDQTAAHYYKTAKLSGKETKPAAASLPPCADPGPFVYTPAVAVVAGAAAAPAPTPTPTPAAAIQPAKKS